jgi:hypothetical protein
MFVFLLSNYSLPFTLIELDSFDCTHTPTARSRTRPGKRTCT